MTWSTTVEIYNLTDAALTIRENGAVVAEVAAAASWSMEPTASAHDLELDFALADGGVMSGRLTFSSDGTIYMDRGNLPEPEVQYMTLGGIVEGSELTQTANNRGAAITSAEWAAGGGAIRMTFTKNIG